MTSNTATPMAIMDDGANDVTESDSRQVFLSMAEVLEEPLGDDSGDLKDKSPAPVNQCIADEQARWIKECPKPTTLRRGVRLRTPELCWVVGCDELARRMPYLLKYYGGSYNSTLIGGVDQDCPFLCEEHHREDVASWERGYGKYTNRCGWANIVIHRRIIPDLHLFQSEAA